MGTLRNIEAINKMIVGDHRSQTKTSSGGVDPELAAKKVYEEKARIAEAEKSRKTKRAIGESWVEKDVRTGRDIKVTQMKGYRKTEPISIVGRHIRSEYFTKCYEDCEKKGYTPIDYKVAKRTSMCLDCLTRYETRLRLQGGDVFEKYVLDKMKNNAISFFRDTDDELEDYKEQLKNPPALVFVDGRTEELKVPDMTGMIESIDTNYKEFKDKILNNLDHEQYKARKLDTNSTN